MVYKNVYIDNIVHSRVRVRHRTSQNFVEALVHRRERERFRAESVDLEEGNDVSAGPDLTIENDKNVFNLWIGQCWVNNICTTHFSNNCPFVVE